MGLSIWFFFSAILRVALLGPCSLALSEDGKAPFLLISPSGFFVEVMVLV